MQIDEKQKASPSTIETKAVAPPPHQTTTTPPPPPPARRFRTAITSFDAREHEAPGYSTKTETNVKAVMEKQLRRHLDALSLNKAVNRGVFTVVGSNDPLAEDRKEYFLMCSRDKCATIQSWLTLDEPVRDIIFPAHDLVVAATGEGSIRVVQVQGEGRLQEHVCWTDCHFEAVREMAPNQLHIGQFASGGLDKRLCIFDINTKNRIMQRTSVLDNVIGSVRWPTCNQNVCVSCTLDTGSFLVYDIRQSLVQPAAFQATLGKPDLFAHERYTDYHVIFGFGDGEIQHIDMRVHNRILHKYQDPYVEGITNIKYDVRSDAFVVSGYTDFNVWKANQGVARVWSHADAVKKILHNTSGLSTFADFIGPSTVMVSTSSGHTGVYEQDWNVT